MKVKKPGIIHIECYASAEEVYDGLCDQIAKAFKAEGYKNIEHGESVTASKRAKVGDTYKSTVKIPINLTVVAEIEYEEDDD